MTVSVGQSGQFNTTGASSVTSGTVTTQASGSTFIIATQCISTNTINTPTDSKGNTYVSMGSAQNFYIGGGHCQLFSCVNGVGGAGHTFTTSMNVSGFMVSYFLEALNVDTTSPIEAYAVTAGDSVSPYETTSGTTTSTDELLVSYIAENGSGTASYVESSGFTVNAQQSDETLNYSGAIGSRVVSSTGTWTPSWTRTGANGGTVFVFGLKGAVGGGVTSTGNITLAPATVSASGNPIINSSSDFTTGASIVSASGWSGNITSTSSISLSPSTIIANGIVGNQSAQQNSGGFFDIWTGSKGRQSIEKEKEIIEELTDKALTLQFKLEHYPNDINKLSNKKRNEFDTLNNQINKLIDEIELRKKNENERKRAINNYLVRARILLLA